MTTPNRIRYEISVAGILEEKQIAQVAIWGYISASISLIVAIASIYVLNMLWFPNRHSEYVRYRLVRNTADYFDEQGDSGYGNDHFSFRRTLGNSRSRAIIISSDIIGQVADKVAVQLIALDEIDSKRPIDLYVNTRGGLKFDSWLILDAMRRVRAPVNVWALGECDSAGTMILAGATGHRYATPNSILMVHVNESDDAHPDPNGEAVIMRRAFKTLWREHTRLPGNWYPFLGDHRYFLTPEQALKLHIIDETRPAW